MRLTLFSGVTLFVMAWTVWMVFARFRYRVSSRWFLLYYVLILAFSRAFAYSLNTWWVCAGVAAGVLLRFAASAAGPAWMAVRGVELAFFGYVLWRGVGLLLGW